MSSSKTSSQDVFKMSWTRFYQDECLLGGDNNSTIKEHHLFCNHSSSFGDFSISATDNNDFKVTLEESYFRQQRPLSFEEEQVFATFETFCDWGT